MRNLASALRKQAQPAPGKVSNSWFLRQEKRLTPVTSFVVHIDQSQEGGVQTVDPAEREKITMHIYDSKCACAHMPYSAQLQSQGPPASCGGCAAELSNHQPPADRRLTHSSPKRPIIQGQLRFPEGPRGRSLLQTRRLTQKRLSTTKTNKNILSGLQVLSLAWVFVLCSEHRPEGCPRCRFLCFELEEASACSR